MSDKPNTTEATLADEKLNLIDQLLALNSRHLKSEGHLAGVDFAIASCRRELEQPAAPPALREKLDELVQQYQAILEERAHIDNERARLTDELQELDDRISEP